MKPAQALLEEEEEEKKDANEIEIFTKTGVTYANNQVIGYDLASLLRWGVFQLSVPKEAKGGNFLRSFAFVQALAVTITSNIIFGVCVGFHKIGAFAADQQEVLVLVGVERHFSAMTMLLFSFFVFKSLAAYNQIRSTHLGGLAGGLVNLMHLTRLWIPGLGEDDALFKATIKRWGKFCEPKYASLAKQVVLFLYSFIDRAAVRVGGLLA